MTDYIERFIADLPAVGDDTYALYYPYDGGLDVGFDTTNDAWEWRGQVAAEAPEQAEGAYVVRVRIDRVEADE